MNASFPTFALCLSLAACSSSGAGSQKDAGSGADADLASSGSLDGGGDTTLLGIWTVSGSDTRGAYTGQLELRTDGMGGIGAIRIIQYTTVTVEEGRSLWWVWNGTANANGGGMDLAVSLRRADFVRSRGGITRGDADRTPAQVTGKLSVSNGSVTVHWSGDAGSFDDTLSDRTGSNTAPIFESARTSTPANDTPSASTKSALDSLYATYQSRPDVMPYVMDPAFKVGVLDLVVDKTDFDFYQAHDKALRIVDKLIDAPSQGEALSRAAAYDRTLAAKAAFYTQQTETDLIDPLTGQLADSFAGGVRSPSNSAALWTATYMMSELFRYRVTGDTTAIDHVAHGADGMLLLMEILPDQTQFARAVWPTSGTAVAPWVAGVGAYTAYDWLDGGNNDMFKGLVYGTLAAFLTLCDPVISGQAALCTRLKTGIKHLQSLSVAGGTTDNNHLMAVWLSAYANNDSGDLTSAVTSWLVLSGSIEQANFTMKSMATADWSGTHLGFVQMMSMWLLADKKPLPGFDAKASIKKGINTMRDNFQPFRMGLWSVLFATLADSPATVDIDAARWRLREVPAPKIPLDVDHRVGAGFVMSPYPELPWKNDWATNDRTSSLHGYPMFELALDVYSWRLSPFRYQGDSEGSEHPGADYLHAYWLARSLGLLTATE